MVTKEQYFMILGLYNKLGNPLFKRTKIISREEFCNYLNISKTNSNTYNKIITILSSCLNVHPSFENKKNIEINIPNLDKFIRQTEYFKLVDKFIYTSTHGVAETGV
jgi:hypothetical protein